MTQTPLVTITHLQFRKPAVLMNLNDRLHWAARAARERSWREAAHHAALSLGPPSKRARPRSLVIVDLPVPTVKTRRDPHNFTATIKPIIDGLVDAGMWDDDTPEYVVTMEPRFHDYDTYVRVEIIPHQGDAPPPD